LKRKLFPKDEPLIVTPQEGEEGEHPDEQAEEGKSDGH